MNNKRKCPACLGETKDFISLDENRLTKFI